MAKGDPAPGPVQVLAYADADAFARGHHALDAEYIRLENIPLNVTLTRFDLGDCCLRMGRFAAPTGDPGPSRITAIVRACYNTDRATLCVPIGQPVGPRLNGRDLAANDLLLFAPGATLHLAVHGRHPDWASLDFPDTEFEALLDLWGQPALPRGGDRILRLPPGAAAAGLPEALAAAAALAAAMPGAVMAPGCIPGIRDGLHELLRRIFAAANLPAAPSPRRTRDVLRVVDAADQFLREHIERPIYTEELCAALAVSPRTLHNAFVAAYAVSPHTYLKFRRLALVRRALTAREHPARLVKSIALSHGFWHMGHFAHDYFALFGEMPSHTLEGPPAPLRQSPARRAADAPPPSDFQAPAPALGKLVAASSPNISR